MPAHTDQFALFVCTELSKFIWTLKDRNIDYTLTWSIIARAKAYSSRSKFCNLCITEKFFIMCKTNAGLFEQKERIDQYVPACQ